MENNCLFSGVCISLVGWVELVGWLCRVGWLVGSSVLDEEQWKSVVCSTVCVYRWLVGWLVLVGVGWLVGWLVDIRIHCNTDPFAR